MVDKYKQFEVWVELEHELGPISDQEYCNAEVHFPNNQHVGIVVWSKKFFEENFNRLEWIDDQFATLPDLIVRDFSSKTIRNAISKLIKDEDWLNGRGFPSVD